MMESSTVVVFSNPFGYGPTGKAVALMENLANTFKGEIVYAASKLCQELLTEKLKNRVMIITIDERNEEKVGEVLDLYQNAFVLSILNRFAIKAAYERGLTSALVDSLSWMWKTIPEEYRLATYYFCFNVFDAREKLKDMSNAKLVPPALGDLPARQTLKQNYTLFHVGGFKNPYKQEIMCPYLDPIIEVLNKRPSAPRIVFTGSQDAVEYVAMRTSNSVVECVTQPRDQFLQSLNGAAHFITTPGLTAILEAFALGAPMSFLLPSNLSQWQISRHYHANGCVNSLLQWSEFGYPENELSEFTEKEAVEKIDAWSGNATSNQTTFIKMATRIHELFETQPDTSAQDKYMRGIGSNGADVIISTIQKHLA